MQFTAILPDNIPSHETIVLPISMAQPLERGDRLAAILKAFRNHKYHDRTTILVCDFLNRHNCDSEEMAFIQGEQFLNEHASILKGFNVVRWKPFLDDRDQVILNEKLNAIQTAGKEGSKFYGKMKKTWEKCLSASQRLEASIHYQIEEYASILCMNEFDHLFYPKRITNGMAYLYNFFEGKKPCYHHIKVSEIKPKASNVISTSHEVIPDKKDRRHIHIAFRALLEHMDILLASGELSTKAKEIFAEEAENILMTHRLLDLSINLEPTHSGEPPQECILN